jgi:uncharacterized membrane protein YraQ (UPF0718 family)
VLLWLFLGWQFVLALYVGAFLLVALMVALIRLTCPRRLADEARRKAGEVEGMEGGRDALPDGWAQRLRSGRAWARVGDAFVGEWRMAGREILIGFLIAGAVAALVPPAVFETVFPPGLPAALQAPLHAVIAPFVAFATVIGSMGNGPLAALFWQNGVAFAGVMAFLASDFVVPPALKINATYYGWRFALYLGVIFAIAGAITGTVVQGLFSVLGLIPERTVNLVELAAFALDHTFWLNVVALGVTGALLWARRRGQRAPAPEMASPAP